MDENDTPPDTGPAAPTEPEGADQTDFRWLIGQASQGPFPHFAPGLFGNLPGAPGTPPAVPLGGFVGNPPALAPLAGMGFPLPADTAPQLAPQGYSGNLIGNLGPQLGGAGSPFGNAVLSTQIGSLAGQLGHYLPFSADLLASLGMRPNAPGAPPKTEDEPPAS